MPTSEPSPHAQGPLQRRTVSRCDVELEAAWRPVGDTRAPTLVLLVDLSTRGARIASWGTETLAAGSVMELHIGPERCHALVRRVISPTEFGVELQQVSHDLKLAIIRTIGANRVSPSPWQGLGGTA